MHLSTSSLKSTDLGMVRQWLQRTQQLFMESFEMEVFQFIINRTLPFHKYAERIFPRQFSKGIVGSGIMQTGLLMSDRHLRRIRDSLTSKGLIFWDDTKVYLLNLPGVISTWRSLCAGRLPNWSECNKIFEEVENDYGEFYPEFDFTDVEVNPKVMANMEGQLEKGFATSAKAKERKRLQRHARPQVRENDISPLMKEFCQEHGLTYVDSWTGKTKGSARNFLNYCTQEGRDPRNVLREVVEFWSRFRMDALKRDDGRYICLRETVSFSEYFAYRHHIDAWVASNRHLKTPEDSEQGEILHRTEKL